MRDTLDQFCENNPEATEIDRDTFNSLVGDESSPFYGVIQYIVDNMLWNITSTSRCLILYGVTSSGKSTLTKYLAEIFDSYTLTQCRGNFDEDITPEKANV